MFPIIATNSVVIDAKIIASLTGKTSKEPLNIKKK
jgi:hypothetical protein